MIIMWCALAFVCVVFFFFFWGGEGVGGGVGEGLDEV